MTEQEQYNELMRSRAALAAEVESGGIEDLAGAEEESAGASDVMKARQMEDQTKLQQQSQASAAEGGKISKAGDATMTAGAASGNPYVAAAGMVMKATGAVDDAHRAGEQAKIDAYNKKIMGQRAAIRNIFA